MEPFDEIVQEFLVESYDSLDQLDRDFVALEEAPDDRERLSSIFRTVHTIKGTSGFLAMPKLEKVAHVGENLLVPLRDGELTLNNEMTDSLLGMVDAIREILTNVETTGAEGDQEYDEIVRRLEQANSHMAGEADTAGELSDAVAEPVIENDAVASEVIPDAHEADTPVEQQATVDEPAPDTPTAEPQKPITPPEKSLSDSSVRISVELLDQLMNLVGELVLTRNQILQYGQDSADAAITAASQRLNQITTELQEGVMKTRMQPIRNAWNKLPRVVRDLSAGCGKHVQVEMEGADTELDKTILEAIKDPLTHIVRNSVDHGIESPEVRASAGKPAEGTLWLRAYHEGGQVIIEIADDGAGINVERVRAKALEKGLITPDKAEAMSERELTSLILLPGFSTAEQVTNVSGRGVGMDVVRTNIEKIGGSLEIQSVSGQGTTLRIKIPLTLAIVPALVITAGGERYAIPQVSLLELVRLEGKRARDEIEMIHDVPVYRLRGNLLPLLYLDDQLGLTRQRSEQHAADDEHVNIVVLQAEDRQFGLVVDSINDTQEIVVKPLGKQLKSVTTFAGATIMGDGAVALILDVVGLAHAGSILTEHHDQALADKTSHRTEQHSPVTSMLIVDQGDGTRAAIELATVARLEEFDPSDIEQTDQGAVVQYRGGILPLISLAGGVRLPVGEEHSEPNQIQVVVFSSDAGTAGVVVGRIIDVVEYTLDGGDEHPTSELHVIQERVTKIVDLASTVQSAFPRMLATPA